MIYVIEGEGVFHVGGTERPIGPGTCIHLPPLVPHCLENKGDRDLRVLGVFHPSGDRHPGQAGPTTPSRRRQRRFQTVRRVNERKAGIALLLVAAAASMLAAGSTAATDSARGPQAASSADRALIRCGTRVRVGIAAPITGQVASLGGQQLGWAQLFVSRWNRFHKLKVTLVQGDTQLPDTAAALRAAQQLAGNSQVLGVVGPAGSQEVIVSSPPFKSRGLGFVTGSATRTTLTQEPIRRGYVRRPPDSVQSTTVANYVSGTLKAQRVFIIDDQEAYGVGLSNEVQAKLRAKNVTVTRDSVNVGQVSDFLLTGGEDPGEHAGRLHPVADRGQGPALRPAAA